MKRYRLVFILLGLGIIYANSQDSIVVIPDTAFLHALIDEGVDLNGDSLISYAEAEAVNSLDVSGEVVIENDTCWKAGTITSLEGIESFVNLDTLKCDDNQLSNLDVSYNNALKLLDCGGNHLVSLDVSKNTALSLLNCNGNQLTSLDVSANTVLASLMCKWNQITSLDVSENTALTYLSCSANQLTSLDVSGCSALKGLSCGDNQLTSLDVSSNIALTDLICGSDGPLQPGGNQLTSLDVSNNTALTLLSCAMNQLISLDVSKNTALESLVCWGNQLTSLDISNNTVIFWLYLDNMPSLHEVCVWEGFNEDSIAITTYNSPNVCFQADCNGDCSVVGVEESCQEGISIYPNPTYDLLTIETIHPGHGFIEITSLNGQRIFAKEVEGITHQIDLSSLQKGIFFITIRAKDLVETRKFIKL